MMYKSVRLLFSP